jgi:hypothetical protein
MLDRTGNSTGLGDRQAETGEFITGQSLAKRKSRTARDRAKIAARWLTGGIYVRPTVKMVSQACQVSIQLVIEETTKIEAAGGAKPIADTIWSVMSVEERIEFVKRHVGEIWFAIDVITSA